MQRAATSGRGNASADDRTDQRTDQDIRSAAWGQVSHGNILAAQVVGQSNSQMARAGSELPCRLSR